jgi:hypothetical protein
MGLMDKVKAQANQLAQKAQETAQEGKARIDQAQANKHADVLLRNLGAMVYAERTGRGAADSQDQITRLIGEISAHEAENGINLSSQPTGWMPGQPPSGQAPPGGFGGPGSTPFAGGPTGPGGTPFGDPGASSFPDAGGSSFGQPAPSAFPDAGGTAFPPSEPTSFPDAGGATSFPQSEPTQFPDAGDTGFPPETGSQPPS